MRKKDEICKERDALQAECQQLKHEMEKAEEKSLKIHDTSTAIQVRERPLRVSTLVCLFSFFLQYSLSVDLHYRILCLSMKNTL
jgi:hypothetical protein